MASIPILFLESLIYFIIIATIADTLFVPNLSSIAHIYDLNPQIAGVTLVAFANGCGDIFTAISSFDAQPELAIGDMTGSAVFVTVCTFGLINYLYINDEDCGSVCLDLGFFCVVILIWGSLMYYGTLGILQTVLLLVL